MQEAIEYLSFVWITWHNGVKRIKALTSAPPVSLKKRHSILRYRVDMDGYRGCGERITSAPTRAFSFFSSEITAWGFYIVYLSFSSPRHTDKNGYESTPYVGAE